jgi:hypothetical protein
LLEFSFTEDNVIDILSGFFRAPHRIDDGNIYFQVRGIDTQEFLLSRPKLKDLLAAITAKDVNDEMGLYSDNSYEIIVNEESPFPMARSRSNEDILRVTDSETNMEYEVSTPSDEYTLWLICTASAKGSLNDLRFPLRYRLEKAIADSAAEAPSAFDAFRALSMRTYTLKLNSTTKQSLRRYQTAINSFLFHLAYNLDLAYVPQRFFEEVSRRGRIRRMRRSTAEELDPPRRTYNEDLVNHYILGISTDNPTVQFLSYYHVLEHFFESVFSDDLIEQIKLSITQPGFSYKRKKDVGQLVNTIKKSLQIRSETITFSESEALRLSLAKYVDVDQLVARLDEYDPSLVEYYSSTEVPFSKGNMVSLRSSDKDRTVKDLTRRIYSTRNSLVHSKDGDKARYIPFKDERALVSEIPLMRFISELVILAVSEVS